jgi:DNA-binding PadR family transcriptional regulator
MAAPHPRSFLPLPHLPLHILLVLSEGAQHGWALVKRIEELTSGMTRPSSGSLYLALSRLREQGLVQPAPRPADATDARRQYHALTPLGREVLGAEMDRLQGLVDLGRAAGAGPGPGPGPNG